MDASRLFEEYVSKFLSLLREADAEYDKCNEHLKKVEKLYSEMKGDRTKEQASELESEIDLIQKSVEKVVTIVNTSLPGAFKPIQRRIYFISIFFSNTEIFTDITSKMNNAIGHVNQQREDFSKRLNLFIETIKKQDETAKSC